MSLRNLARDPPAAEPLPERPDVKHLLAPLLLCCAAAGSAVESTGAPLPHCQVPCGIYGDRMRIDMHLEDVATIEKGMKMIQELEASPDHNANQLVRWVVNKDEHAQAIQERTASYWLAQRIKAPKEGDAAGREKYVKQLELLHGITVAAMKCKQTTELEHVEALRTLALSFSETYFTEEDLKHIKEHQGQR
jgi:nickel superoxide dismutase